MATRMSRRTVAAFVAFALLIGLGLFGLHRPVGYTLFSPGPTVNVLGTSDGKPIIEVSGHPTYRDKGGLRLVTVYESSYDSKVSLLGALQGWIDPDVGVYPHDAVYPDETTNNVVRQQSAAQMASSQDDAVAAALRALGIGYTTVAQVAVAAVDDAGPSHDVLRTGDVIASIDGTAVTTPDQLVALIRDKPPGSKLGITVTRGGDRRTFTVTTTKLGAQGKQAQQSKIGVSVGSRNSYHFPFDVTLHLSDNIGGPSAGLMFALGVYDVLTPGSLTDGKVIAGTGEIDAQGKVGEIGGVQQKIAGAQHDGARLFLVPAGNCAEAVGAHYDSGKIRLVKVSTMSDALAALKAWATNPDASLPRCTK